MLTPLMHSGPGSRSEKSAHSLKLKVSKLPSWLWTTCALPSNNMDSARRAEQILTACQSRLSTKTGCSSTVVMPGKVGNLARHFHACQTTRLAKRKGEENTRAGTFLSPYLIHPLIRRQECPLSFASLGQVGLNSGSRVGRRRGRLGRWRRRWPGWPNKLHSPCCPCGPGSCGWWH